MGINGEFEIGMDTVVDIILSGEGECSFGNRTKWSFPIELWTINK